MLLKNLLKNVNYSCSCDIEKLDVKDIIYDSRKVCNNSVFVCLKGCDADGHKFYQKAITAGAAAIIAQDQLHDSTVPVIYVQNTREALAHMSCEFFDNPAKKLKTIGITGTKGKTTTACMIKAILKESGINAGLIGTLGAFINDQTIKTNNTTPESYEIQKYLSLMVENGCSAAILEVSSIGLKSNRVDGITFDYGIFTNFSSDHIGGNEHQNVQEYLICKSILFKKCKIGILNIDDENCENILNGHTCETFYYGFSKRADLFVKSFSLLSSRGFLGTSFTLSGKLNCNITLNIPGKFNIYNAMSAIAVCNFLGVDKESIVKALKDFEVKGRIECLEVPGDYTLIIDYAHNALSMENLLNTLKEYNPARLIVLFGAGGNRPKIRRYEMGEVAGRIADLSVITEDNSRNEDVSNIIADIEVGLRLSGGNYVVIPNRYEAIKYCVLSAQTGDVIVLAGKGHEDYLEIKGTKHKFDEREVVQDILKSESAPF